MRGYELHPNKPALPLQKRYESPCGVMRTRIHPVLLRVSVLRIPMRGYEDFVCRNLGL